MFTPCQASSGKFHQVNVLRKGRLVASAQMWAGTKDKFFGEPQASPGRNSRGNIALNC
jgi:hypothetical protein